MSNLHTNLIYAHELDEASGTRQDAHTGDRDLTDNNTVPQAAGKIGSAASFDAANTEYLSRASEAALQTGDIDFTFIVWVYVPNFDNYRGILSKGRAESAAGTEYEAYVNQTTGTISFAVRKADDSLAITVSSAALSVDTWTMVEMYHDATANLIAIRLNNGAAATSSISGGVYASSAHALQIGALNGTFPFHGRIDLLRFYKRRLTAAETTAHYAAGAGLAYPLVSLSITGPATATVGQQSTQGTVDISSGAFDGANTITFNDGGDGGTFHTLDGGEPTSGTGPLTVTPEGSETSLPWSYTPASAGTKTITIANNSGFTNPSNHEIVVSAGGGNRRLSLGLGIGL